MQLKKRITEQYHHNINVKESGLTAIFVSARCKSEKQINSTDDEDLQIEINGMQFREIPPLEKPQYKDIPSAFNGANLRGLKKTVVFFLWLDKGEHTISCIPDQSAVLEDISFRPIKNTKNINLIINEQAEDGDRRHWYTFVFIGLSLKSISATVIVKSRWLDRDDVQIKIDGEIQMYKDSSKLHKLWYWIGSILKGKEETAYFTPRLKEGLHYIEFNADRMPILKRVSFNIGDAPPKGVIADTNHQIKTARFRKTAKIDQNNILQKIPLGETVEIITERVKGDRAPDMSDIWHKVRYKRQEGYIISTYVDIEAKTQKDIQEKIIKIANKHNIDPDLMRALAKEESYFKPYASSQKDARGVFQLTQIAIDQLGQESMKDLKYDIKDYFNIEQNIEGGVRYFKWLYKIYYKDDKEAREKAVAAYNAGQVRVPRSKQFAQINLPDETKKHLRNVLQYWGEFKQSGFGKIKVLGFGALGIIMFSILLIVAAHILPVTNQIRQSANAQEIPDQEYEFLEIIEEDLSIGQVLQISSLNPGERLYQLKDDLDRDGNIEILDFRFYYDVDLGRHTTVKIDNQALDLRGAFLEAYAKDINKDNIKEVVIELAVGMNGIWTEIYLFNNNQLTNIPVFDEGDHKFSGFLGRGIEFIDYDKDGDLEVQSFWRTYDMCGLRSDIYKYLDQGFVFEKAIIIGKQEKDDCDNAIEEFKG